MLRRVARVRTDVWKEYIVCIIMVTRMGELGTLAVLQLLVTDDVVPSSTILVTLMMGSIHSSETLVLTEPPA
jgi:hypothetical protein